MHHTEISREEVQARAEAIYQKDIRPKYEETHKGQICIIDIMSGDYEIDKHRIDASRKLRERRPDGRTLTIRIGYPAVYTLGGGMRRYSTS